MSCYALLVKKKSDMTITCVSPYLDKSVKFNNYGTFVESLTTGELSTSLKINCKGAVSITEVPFLSPKEHSLYDKESFASYCGLTYQEEEMYKLTDIISSISYLETLEKKKIRICYVR